MSRAHEAGEGLLERLDLRPEGKGGAGQDPLQGGNQLLTQVLVLPAQVDERNSHGLSLVPRPQGLAAGLSAAARLSTAHQGILPPVPVPGVKASPRQHARATGWAGPVHPGLPPRASARANSTQGGNQMRTFLTGATVMVTLLVLTSATILARGGGPLEGILKELNLNPAQSATGRPPHPEVPAADADHPVDVPGAAQGHPHPGADEPSPASCETRASRMPWDTSTSRRIRSIR